MQTLLASQHRAITLLLVISADPVIQTQLEEALGWGDKDQDEAWSLIDAHRRTGATAPPRNVVAEAVARCEAWQDRHIPVARATLELRHPAQAAFVFQDVAPGRGLEAVIAVSVFLSQLDALQSGAERKSTRKADHAALTSLEEREITREVRKEILGSIEVARKGDLPPQASDWRPAYVENLHRLHVWLQYWSELIRGVVTRRDQLIRLGLARRRQKAPRVATPRVAPPPAVPLLAPTGASRNVTERDERAPDSRVA